ncbi:MAG: hypothetical protein ACKPJJ_35080, partial [Planctomycetaceae bacterium]
MPLLHSIPLSLFGNKTLKPTLRTAGRRKDCGFSLQLRKHPFNHRLLCRNPLTDAKIIALFGPPLAAEKPAIPPYLAAYLKHGSDSCHR